MSKNAPFAAIEDIPFAPAHGAAEPCTAVPSGPDLLSQLLDNVAIHFMERGFPPPLLIDVGVVLIRKLVPPAEAEVILAKWHDRWRAVAEAQDQPMPCFGQGRPGDPKANPHFPQAGFRFE
ncbi:hypothetical protein [Roseomonas populi]|uniref:Uncharacterized protein n=1 Tax=Roseomonas populi TaxID=3121582 RepID=A0ABT1XAP9_9PROT|nr:hypothetical protein [Roseomonas pecuniae]MCR0985207.1 hypothetical protein [Roseomonas pecuniae]